MRKEILTKFLNNKCNEEEIQEIIHWVEKESLNNQSINWGKQNWKEFEPKEEQVSLDMMNSILDKIHHDINLRDKKHNEKAIVKFTTWFARIAAIVILPVMGILIYLLLIYPFGTTKNYSAMADSLEIVTPIGSRTLVQLSDGSEVYLNHGSTLKYPQKFNDKKREVILTGEGFFKVVHNQDWPFVVITNKLNILALGTTFNVLAYPNDDLIETTLVEGKVTIEKKFGADHSNIIGSLVPQQHVSYNIKTGNILSSKGDIDQFISWKDGKLIFKNESIIDITNRLSRWYNVKFDFKDKEVMNYTYTATFVDESLTQILDLMKIATPIDYKISPREKLPDGTFSKQTIILEKRK